MLGAMGRAWKATGRFAQDHQVAMGMMAMGGAAAAGAMGYGFGRPGFSVGVGIAGGGAAMGSGFGSKGWLGGAGLGLVGASLGLGVAGGITGPPHPSDPGFDPKLRRQLEKFGYL